MWWYVWQDCRTLDKGRYEGIFPNRNGTKELKVYSIESMTNVCYLYTQQTDMLFTYGRTNGNDRVTARLYRDKHLKRRQPRHTTFTVILRRESESGHLIPPHSWPWTVACCSYTRDFLCYSLGRCKRSTGRIQNLYPSPRCVSSNRIEGSPWPDV